MVVVGTIKDELKDTVGFAAQAEKLLRDASCRVLFCKS
jgi:hypothetical protein